jgi:hypothetical protein
MAADRIDQIAGFLDQVSEIHHAVFVDTDGTDEDWASFYSDWLLAHSSLPELLGRTPVRSHLVRDLVVSDEQYTAENPAEPWPQWYARRLITTYG